VKIWTIRMDRLVQDSRPFRAPCRILKRYPPDPDTRPRRRRWQLAVGVVFAVFARRLLESVSAHGWKGNLGPASGFCDVPDHSRLWASTYPRACGLPSGVSGVGSVKVRLAQNKNQTCGGMPAVGCPWSHCADKGRPSWPMMMGPRVWLGRTWSLKRSGTLKANVESRFGNVLWDFLTFP